jgi:hypothetical protein
VILVDANYFLRYLVQPTTPAQQARAEAARWLFEAVQRGEEEITTSFDNDFDDLPTATRWQPPNAGTQA